MSRVALTRGKALTPNASADATNAHAAAASCSATGTEKTAQPRRHWARARSPRLWGPDSRRPNVGVTVRVSILCTLDGDSLSDAALGLRIVRPTTGGEAALDDSRVGAVLGIERTARAPRVLAGISLIFLAAELYFGLVHRVVESRSRSAALEDQSQIEVPPFRWTG